MSNFGSVGSIHCATIIAVDSHTSTFIRAKFAARFDDKRESPPPRERERERERESPPKEREKANFKIVFVQKFG